MQVIHHIADLRQALASSDRTAFVPTMGNLHEGHLSLIRQAKTAGGPVVASIFVNRLQFAPHEDFDTYPRTLERDCELLQSEGCDIVFAPSEKELYPEPQTYKVTPPPELADILEGHFRPEFFTGVCTVVLKLFNCVQPYVAVFGKKDYQQCLIIKRMVEQLALPIQIIGVPTQRASSGLALSSRNGYLSPSELTQSAQLQQVLQHVRQQLIEGNQNFAQLEAQAQQQLVQWGWQPDYVAIRQQADLSVPSISTPVASMIVLTAARIGKTRLIDNIEC